MATMMFYNLYHRNPKPLDYEVVTNELRSMRERSNRGCEGFRATHPFDGWWFGDVDNEETPCGLSRIVRCAFCGDPGDTVRDHCHTTGLGRGPLCRSCNTREGNTGDDDPTWNAWRLAAPELAVGLRWIYRPENSFFTFNDLMTAPMSWLFAETHRYEDERRRPIVVPDLY